MRKFLNKKGFSMIELMVVVAIIGVLAAIGIPQYSKFQAKARQSEAKLSLAALFTSEESFRQEWNQFSVDLVNVGFGVQGSRLRYITGFLAAGCTGYTTASGAPAETVNVTNTYSDGTNVRGTATWMVGIAGTYPAASAWWPVTCTTTTFVGGAYGSPAADISAHTNANGDAWTVNQTKLISNTQVRLGN